jgi:hypothetical protein
MKLYISGGIALCELIEQMSCTTTHIIMDAIYNVDIYMNININHYSVWYISMKNLVERRKQKKINAYINFCL